MTSLQHWTQSTTRPPAKNLCLLLGHHSPLVSTYLVSPISVRDPYSGLNGGPHKDVFTFQNL